MKKKRLCGQHLQRMFGSKALKIMKLSTFLFFVCVFSLSANVNVFSQRVTLNVEDAELREVFRSLREQTGCMITYSEDKVDSERIKVTANLENVDLKEALDQILGDLPYSYSIEGQRVFIIPSQKKMRSQPQRQVQADRTISGIVLDAERRPLVGVSVVVQGTTKGVTTDINGQFRLTVSYREGMVLQFSYVGKKNTELRYTGQERIQVIMEDSSSEIGQIVVTGYQNIAKEKMTGSAISVTAQKLDERYTPNILSNLEGRVAGLTTYGGKTTIRGSSSLYAKTNPLLVVDGIPIEGKIEDLNPYDIENITVLKDAAATAIYGARASNGIIVITTKTAKEKNKINIDFSANLTIYENKNFDYADNFYMNAEQQVKTESDYYEYYFFNNEGEINDPIGSAETAIHGGWNVTPIHYGYYQLATGAITKDALTAQLERFKKNNFAKDFGENIARRQILQQYNLALRNRSDIAQSNLTLNYKYDNTGVVGANFKQFNVDYKGVFEIAPWLTATFSANGLFERSVKTKNDDAINPWNVPAYYSLYDENGDYSWSTPYSYGNKYDTNTEDNPNMLSMRFNHKEELEREQTSVRRQHMRYHGDLLFRIIDGLSARAQVIYETSEQTTSSYSNPQSYTARLIRNAYTQFTDGVYSYLTPRTGGMLNSVNLHADYWTARGQLNYTKTFGAHSFAALAGMEFRDTKYKGTRSLMLGYDDQLQSSSTHMIDFGVLSQLVYSPYYANQGYPAKQNIYDIHFANSMLPIVEEHHRYASGYANLTYTYDDRYNVFASFRKDYADVYGLNAKFRGKPLWSVGAGWNIHNERFMDNVDWVSFLKTRVSYGVTGNIYQGATSYMTATSTGINPDTNLPVSNIESPANPELKWEQTRTLNVGVDYSFLKNRLRGSFDWYRKEGKDIFSNKSLEPSTGFSSMFVNMASMVNDGIEMQISYDWFTPQRSRDFEWSTSFTFSHNKNKITSVENQSTLANELIRNTFKEGYPASALFSYRFAEINDRGQTMWYGDGDAVLQNVTNASIDALVYSGQSDPKIVMGLDNRLAYKGFSLSVLMTYYGGHKMRVLEENETMGVPSTAIPSYFLNAYTPENPTNTPGIGRYTSSVIYPHSRYADYAVRPADFLKIRNIVFGYDFSQSFLSQLGIKRLGLRLQIDNPKALWVRNKVGIDPETLSLRNPSSFVFGVNINL